MLPRLGGDYKVDPSMSQNPVQPPSIAEVLRQALDVLQRLYDQTGAPDLKPILDDGTRALKRGK